MPNPENNIDKDVLQKGIVKLLRRSVNHLDYSFGGDRNYIPEFFTAIAEFVTVNKMAIDNKLDQPENPYFYDYCGCLESVKEIIKEEFGEKWKMAGEW
jgi:hypothetical protein